MEKLQGPIIHPCLFEEHLGAVGCLEEENGIMMGINYGQFLNRFEVDPHCSLPSLEDKMPFLQMLQGVESQPPPPPLPPPLTAEDTAAFPLMQEPNFQFLLRLQQEKLISMRSCFAGDQLVESCLTNNNNNDIITMDNNQLHSSSGHERENHQKKKGGRSAKKTAHLDKSSAHCGGLLAGAGGRERKKRKRVARPSKNKEQVESQRMTHIAVERNRRRQMNDHLNALRSLMPPSYVQRGDQASIIGGAIDFVKELEQLLQSLQAQKRIRQTDQDHHHHHHQNGDVSATSTSTSSSSNFLSNMLMASSSSSPPSSSTLQFRNANNYNTHEEGNGNGNNNNQEDNQLCAENRSSVADIEVVVIQNHVNLKIQCQRRPGQLIKAIVALEDLRLSVLHLNITSFHTLVLYSFNLKIEDDCKCRSADEVASAVHQIFSFINIT